MSNKTSTELNRRGNRTDDPCYYVSVVDGPQFAFLAGPFWTHEEALAMVDKTKAEALKYGDPKAWFYGYGTCKAPNGYKEGLLNAKLGI